MANQELTIPTIIQIQQISQVLAADDNSRYTQLKSGSLIGNLPGILYLEGTLLQNMYSLNPSGSTIRSVAEYVLSLCGKYKTQAQTILANLAQTKPIITGPSNQSVFIGDNATFTISVVSSLAYTIAWYRNGVLIPGQTGLTYTLNNAQLSDSGALFSAVATSAAGSTSSSQAVLTVTTALIALTWYGDDDPNPDLQAGIDNLPYQITTVITHNQPIVITIPQVATPNKWFVTKVVDTESLKTIWNNGPFNNGTINPPDGVFNAQLQFGGFTFYPTHEAISLSFNIALTLS